MNVLLLMPKELYILTRFAEACRRHGFSLAIMMAPRGDPRRFLASFVNDAYQTIDELPVGSDDADALAPLLEGFDCVVPGGEFSVILGERLSAKLGVFHNPLERIDAYRNKSLMRKCFEEAGVSQPRVLARFDSQAQVDAFDWSSVKFPVIAKPVDMTASLYVRLCHDAEAARKTYQRIFRHSQSFAGGSFCGQGLLEEVAPGPEYSVECVVQGGALLALFPTTKFVSPYPACDEVAHLSGEPFADESVARSVREAVEGVIRAWQVHSAVMHVEYKVSDGQVRVIEGACRIGGDLISELVELRYGVSLEECLVLLRARRDVRPALDRRPTGVDGHFYGVRFVFAENFSLTVPAEIEVVRAVVYPGSEPFPGGGFGAERRLGHTLVRSRSLPALVRFLGEVITPRGEV